MPKIIAESHFGIAICKEDDSKSLSAAVPTKIGEFLASGRPMIVGRGMGDLDQMLPNSKTGIVIGEKDSLEGVAQRIVQLIVDPSTPGRCRSLAMQHFDVDKAIDSYIAIYGRMLRST
jgi:glycosyltransferase involved in cell wall biosynthesis